MPILAKCDGSREPIKNVNSVQEASQILNCEVDECIGRKGEVLAYIDSNSRYSDNAMNSIVMQYIANRLDRPVSSIPIIRGDAIVLVL